MGSVPFQTTFLVPFAIKQTFKSTAPLVFMNACQTARAAPLYTQHVGWAEQFIAAGAGAFIGSLWEVRSASAALFAEAFYKALANDAPLASAMQSARTAIREETGDPTWLAYAAYGYAGACRAERIKEYSLL